MAGNLSFNFEPEAVKRLDELVNEANAQGERLVDRAEIIRRSLALYDNSKKIEKNKRAPLFGYLFLALMGGIMVAVAGSYEVALVIFFALFYWLINPPKKKVCANCGKELN